VGDQCRCRGHPEPRVQRDYPQKQDRGLIRRAKFARHEAEDRDRVRREICRSTCCDVP
jgi:hypothetical protein